jgi:Transcriptional regulator
MPKKTFLNLPGEQQLKITEAALAEFSAHDFKAASLNNIIDSLDVTKGSFYRYFDSKGELYDYLVEFVSDKKLRFIESSLGPDARDFFARLKKVMQAYAKFDLSFPTYGRFLFNVKYFNRVPESKSNYYKLENILKKMIRQGLSKREINSEFGTDFIYQCVIGITESLELPIKPGSPADYQSERIPDVAQADETIRKFIDFLKYGLQPEREKL